MADTELLLTNRTPEEPSLYDRAIRPALAEFVGVTLFVFVGCCALVSGDIVGAALGHGLTIALLIMGLGDISGGHFNPAVTLGVTLGGGLSAALLPAYWLAQLIGGILGAALARGTLPMGIYKRIGGGVHHLGKIPVDEEMMVLESVSPGWGMLIELVLTTVLVFTVLMVAVNSRTKTKLAPLAIGFAVVVDIMAGGMLTGASMNPARAFGPAVVASAVLDNAWTYHWIYWIGPLLGGTLAALIYKFLFASPSQRWVARSPSF
ncbi:aquaporin-8-like [Mya arenaria]|uniref:aquaporin-8-like n=1 Tax=Mya arenaria TaxID=6604 RepID=UPI0022E0D526|nr:aquaporin-8-like [Mya arenaria]XP_052785993.1 aquaporin-8-like [Mya arenaria]